MNQIFILLFFLFSISGETKELSPIRILSQSDQLLLIEHPETSFEDVFVKVGDESCRTSIKETVGIFSIIKVNKKNINDGLSRKTVCELKDLVKKESIFLIQPVENKTELIKFYISGGLSIGEKYTISNNADVSVFQYNYSLARYKQINNILIGVIYQVYSFRAYGSIPSTSNPGKSIGYDFQYNNFLLGVSGRKIFGYNEKESKYLRSDFGISWSTTGENRVGNPLAESLGAGIGLNLGAGLLIKTEKGALDLGFFQSIRSDQSFGKFGNQFNISIGYMF